MIPAYYLSIIFGVLVILFSLWGVILPSLKELHKYHKLISFSHLAELNFYKRFKVFTILTGITQIIFYTSMYFYLNYGHLEILILFITSAIGLVGVGIFKHSKYKLIHNFFSYAYFLGSIIAIFLLGIATLSSQYLLFSIVSIATPIFIISLALMIVFKKRKKTLFEEFLHTFACYVWIGSFVISLILTK